MAVKLAVVEARPDEMAKAEAEDGPRPAPQVEDGSGWEEQLLLWTIGWVKGRRAIGPDFVAEVASVFGTLLDELPRVIVLIESHRKLGRIVPADVNCPICRIPESSHNQAIRHIGSLQWEQLP